MWKDDLMTRNNFVKKRHNGYFWIEEEAIRLLKRTYDDPGVYRKAVAAYTTLVRTANLKGHDSFEERIGALADDMGYSYCEAAKALKLVCKVGLCEIVSRKIPGTNERDKSIYTVKRILRGKLDENPATSHGNTRTLDGSESIKEITESTQKLTQKLPQEREASLSPRFVPPTEEECKTEARKNEMPELEGTTFFDYYEAKGWKLSNGKPMEHLPAAMRIWRTRYKAYIAKKGPPPSRRDSTKPVQMPWMPDFRRLCALLAAPLTDATKCEIAGLRDKIPSSGHLMLEYNERNRVNQIFKEVSTIDDASHPFDITMSPASEPFDKSHCRHPVTFFNAGGRIRTQGRHLPLSSIPELLNQ